MLAVVTMLEWPSICWITFRSVREAKLGDRGGTVAQIVEPDRRQVQLADQHVEPVGEVLGPDRAPVGVGEQRFSLPPARPGAGPGVTAALIAEPVLHQLDALLDGLAGQPPGALVVEGDGAAAGPALRRPAVQLTRQRDQLAADGQFPARGVEIVAMQPRGLAAAQAAQGDQPPQRGQPVVLNPVQERDELAQRPDRDWRADPVPPPRGDPVGAENSVTSCDLRIFMGQATEPIAAQNPDIFAQSGWTRTPGRRALFQCPVGTVHVVVLDVLTQDQPQVPLAGDQHPVQALAAGAGNPAFRDRIELLSS